MRNVGGFRIFKKKSRKIFLMARKIRLKTPFFGYFLAVFDKILGFGCEIGRNRPKKVHRRDQGTVIDHLRHKKVSINFHFLSKNAVLDMRSKSKKRAKKSRILEFTPFYGFFSAIENFFL